MTNIKFSLLFVQKFYRLTAKIIIILQLFGTRHALGKAKFSLNLSEQKKYETSSSS
jgi:hypothetical protein